VVILADEDIGHKGNKGFMRYVCHQNPDRSFLINGEPMPLCARCTGFYPGMVVGIILCFIIPFLVSMDPWLFFIISLLLLAPMGLDGATQLWRWRTSTNSLRFATGIIGGIGAGFLFGRILADVFLG
jgi:uncharacterized membrane protein